MTAKVTRCSDCYLISLCLTKVLNTQQIVTFENLVTKHHNYQRGEHLLRNNQSVPFLGIIKSGSARTELISYTGDRQVVSFNLPGDLLGLSLFGACESGLLTSVVFLETSTLCTISLSSFRSLAETFPKLRQELVLRLSDEVARQQQLIMAANHFSAETLVTMLLLDLSRRLSSRGVDKKHLHLNMARDDIANYLGLASATVSRILTKFAQAGLIDVKNKNIQLKDFERLEDLMRRSKIDRKSPVSDRRTSQQPFVLSERREYAEAFA